MAVNVSKTQYIIFRPKGAKINVDLENNAIVYNSNEIGKTPDLIKYSNLEEIICFNRKYYLNLMYYLRIFALFIYSFWRKYGAN